MMNDPVIVDRTEGIKSIHESRKDVDKCQKAAMTLEEMQNLIKVNCLTKFGEVQQLVTAALGRCINYSERKLISDSLRSSYCAAAETKRMTEDNGHRGILLFTAYSNDYKIGELCDTINRLYSEKNNYMYLSETLPYEDMMRAIGPYKNHCTWYKVFMLNRLLNSDSEQLSKDKIQVNSTPTRFLIADEIAIDVPIALSFNADFFPAVSHVD